MRSSPRNPLISQSRDCQICFVSTLSNLVESEREESTFDQQLPPVFKPIFLQIVRLVFLSFEVTAFRLHSQKWKRERNL